MEFIEKIKKTQGFLCTGPVDDIIINEAQKELSVKFSSEYLDYIRECGEASFYGHELTGICDYSRLNVVMVTIEERKYNPLVPESFYVIEQANIDGIVIWQSASGEVYQTIPGQQIVKIANSLVDYIEKY